MFHKIKHLLPLLIFAVVLICLATTSMRRKSVTFDELSHLPAGYSYVALGDFHHNPAHPPLVKLLSGLMVKTANPKLDTTSWQSDNEWQFGAKFLYQWNDADHILFRGRLATVLLSLVLGIVIYFAAREIYGWKAGCFALALYLFNPDFLAHGQLVTTDVGAACFFFIAVYCFWRALNQLSLWRILLTGLATGLLLLTKFSGVLIFPMFLMIGALFVAARYVVEAPVLQMVRLNTSLASASHKAAAAAGLILASILISWAMIWASYGFRYRISPDPVFSQKLDWWQFELRNSVPVDLALWAQKNRLIPEAYAYGFAQVIKSIDGRKSFVLGTVATGGFWYFFLVTFLVKTPLAFIILLVLAAFLTKKHGWNLRTDAMLLVPPIFYFVYASITSMNIGHRHILPIYPFLIVYVSRLAGIFDESGRLLMRYAVMALLAWNIISAALVYPHFLSYFNEIAGGPSNGHRWLVDSNLDWGQDLKGLAEWRRAHPEGEMYLSYFGTGDPDYYKLDGQIIANYPQLSMMLYNIKKKTNPADIPPGSLLAVSATNLECLYIDDKVFPGIEAFMAKLRGMKPIDNIGHSIMIYRMP